MTPPNALAVSPRDEQPTTTNRLLTVYEDDRGPVPAAPAAVLATVTIIADPGWWSQETERFLSGEGFAVVLDATGASAFDHRCRAADVALVDLELSTRPAVGVCVAWRRRSTAPIVAISARSDETMVLAAFAAGADHVVAKESSPRELVAHLRSLLRRRRPRRVDAAPPASPVRLGADGRSALVGERSVALTADEFQVLALLLERGDRVVTRAELAGALVYASTSRRAVDFFVRRLREKLEEIDTVRRIVAVRGVGFRFDASGQPGYGGASEATTAEGEDDR